MSQKAKNIGVSIYSTHKIIINFSSGLFSPSGTWLPEKKSLRSARGLSATTYLRDMDLTFKKKGVARCFLDVKIHLEGGE